MKKYKIYLYIISIIFAIGIIYFSSLLYGRREVKYHEVVVEQNLEKNNLEKNAK